MIRISIDGLSLTGVTTLCLSLKAALRSEQYHVYERQSADSPRGDISFYLHTDMLARLRRFTEQQPHLNPAEAEKLLRAQDARQLQDHARSGRLPLSRDCLVNTGGGTTPADVHIAAMTFLHPPLSHLKR